MTHESNLAQVQAWSELVEICGCGCSLVAVLEALGRAESDYAQAGLREGAQALRETRSLALATFSAQLHRVRGNYLPS